MSSDRQKIFLKVLAAIAVFFFVISQAQISYAGFSTVDTYFEQHPDQAVGFAAQLNVNTTTAGSLAATQQAVPVTAQVLDASGKVIATTFNGTTTVASGTNPFLAIFGGGVAVGGIGSAVISTLRNKASQRYAEVYPNDTGATKFRARIRNHNAGCDLSYDFSATSYSIEPHPDPFYKNYGNCGQVGLSVIRATLQDGAIYDYDGGWGVPISITPLDPKKNWEDFSQSRRDTAVSLLTPSDYRDAFQGAGSQLASLPETAAKIRVIPPEGKTAVIIKPDGTTEVISSPTDVSLDSAVEKDTDKDGIPDTQDPDDDNDGISDTEDPDDDNNGVPDAQEINGDVSSAPEPTVFDKPNFLVYTLQVFANKFPLDVIGKLPPGQSLDDCPKVTFYQQPFEVCIIRDFLRMLKIPVVMSFIIWVVVTL